MLQKEREKLFHSESKYLNIGISKGGEVYNATSIPWISKAHVYNMKIPDVYLAPEDLENEEILQKLCEHHILGCYIYAPLRDYGVLSRFGELRDLSIRCAMGETDLAFLRGLKECNMLLLHEARLKSLDVILDMKKQYRSIFGPFDCVGLYKCEVEDLSRFTTEAHRFAEFLVWGSSEESSRWDAVNALKKKYFVLKQTAEGEDAPAAKENTEG